MSMFAYVETDDRVNQLHQLKDLEPSPGMTVRVEDYREQSNLFGDGVVFVWDDGVKPPRSDGEFVKTSGVDGYQRGQANEGVWMALGLTAPSDQGLIVARPTSGPSRAFAPSLYGNSDEAIDAATTYCNAQGGGNVRVPRVHLPIDYFVVSVSSSVNLSVDYGKNRLLKFDDTYSSKDSEGPGAYIGDTSSGDAQLKLAEDLEVHGTTVTVKRDGANALTIATATDATVKGSSSYDIGSDGAAVRLVYDKDADNWVEI